MSEAARELSPIYRDGFADHCAGGLDTFDAFPKELETALNDGASSSEVEYRALVYPPYDTKGNFKLAVSKLRDWLQETVIDIESERGTASPTINASVKVILLGHSMGGLIGSDVLIDIHDEYAPAALFPDIIGIVALDSPMLGLAPSLWTNGADGLFQKGKSFYESASTLTAIGSGLFATKVANQKAIEEKKTSAGFGWKSIAAMSAAGVVAAGGALYAQKDTIGRGFSWITDHLEFIGTLRRPEELSQRTVKVNSIEGVKFSCYYTLLTSKKSVLDGGDRRFVVLPKGDLLRSRFHPQENPNAADEVAAHTSMFNKDANAGYPTMLDNITTELSAWVDEATSLIKCVD